MACDGLSVAGRKIVSTNTNKIHVTNNGHLIGYAGVQYNAAVFVDYYNEVISTLPVNKYPTHKVPKDQLFGEEDDEASTVFLILVKDNVAFTYCSSWPYMERVDSFPHAIGSGHLSALGVLKANPSMCLKKCIKLVSTIDNNTRGRVRQYDLKSKN